MRQNPLQLAALVVCLNGLCTSFAFGENEAPSAKSLRWTPHRAAARPLDTGSEIAGEENVSPASPAKPSGSELAPSLSSAVTKRQQVAASSQAEKTLTDQPALPATVSVPDTIPDRDAKPSLQVVAKTPREDFAPLRKQLDPGRMVENLSEWMADAQPADSEGTVSANQGDDGPFGLGMMRTPQGHNAGRPILSQERPADLQVVAKQREGGGMAPPYTQRMKQSAVRPERLAMDVDKVPSVMARRAQAEAVSPPPVSKKSAKPKQSSVSQDNSISSEPYIPGDSMIIDGPPGSGFESYSEGSPSMGEEMWMGRTPAQLHVESFYDDPYACEENCNPVPCCFDGRFCRWLHQFGRPYYGWKWYRDFTASVGVTAFENEVDLGIKGNFGTNEYLNFGMPLWNAFGLGWQIGARGTQTGFGSQRVSGGGAAPALIEARNQQFVTTGLYTRAFEGRGLQGGAAFDYLNNTGFVGTADIKQMRGEISYVWGYHELGFWGAFNAGKGLGFFNNNTQNTFENNTVHTYNAFYRVQFGDANEWKVWGGASHEGQGYIGSILRAPMTRSLALEGTFAYLMPGESKQVGPIRGITTTFTPMAWNLGINLVYYPRGRSRRSLASPYRPLFDVADNGTMITGL
ncbi:MAG TPA: hypothetical protein DEB70_05730 [Planctomycetaceae bacterium]|nr:hypothetical protein [Planctomycetaceae bacterium]